MSIYKKNHPILGEQASFRQLGSLRQYESGPSTQQLSLLLAKIQLAILQLSSILTALLESESGPPAENFHNRDQGGHLGLQLLPQKRGKQL